MKRMVELALSFLIFICFLGCRQNPLPNAGSDNPDSVKKIIIALNEQIVQSILDPEKYQSFCEDSMLVVGDDEFKTSANAISHDLHGYIVLPHDYTFKLFGHTALLSYLCTRYQIFNKDTNFMHVRDLKTFVFNKGKWKLASYTYGFQTVNYFKPVADKHQKEYPSFAGVYQVNTGIFDSIFVKEGKLYDKMTGSDVMWDFPINDGEYMIQGSLDRIVFGKNSKGVIGYITSIGYDGQKIIWPKIR